MVLRDQRLQDRIAMETRDGGSQPVVRGTALSRGNYNAVSCGVTAKHANGAFSKSVNVETK